MDLRPIILALFVSVASAAEYTNPILPGDWSDPGLIRVGDDYYTCRSTFGWQPGIAIAHSRDLLHWRYIGHAFTSHPKIQPGDTRLGIWGLEMGYNPHTKQFLIYAPTRDGEVFVYYSDKPEGPYATKSLGTNLGIDPGYFADDDGKLYLMTNRAVLHELARDGLSIVGNVSQIDKTPYNSSKGQTSSNTAAGTTCWFPTAAPCRTSRARSRCCAPGSSRARGNPIPTTR